MKKTIFIIIAALFCATSINAQKINNVNAEGYLYSYRAAEEVEVGMKYKELKKVYDPKMYTPVHTDRYNPNLAGLSSFFMPGLGQMTCKENGRGWAFLGSYIGCFLITSACTNATLMGTENTVIDLVAGLGSIACATINIWSIVDAVKVAKVKNMYDQDLKKKYFQPEVSMHPSVSYMNTANGPIPTAGMSLALRF